MAVIAFGLIASAVCALVGPLFVPFFIVPKLDWLFWGWLKAFIQYSFIPVVAIAFLMVFERFIFRYVTTLPPDDHGGRIWGLRASGRRRDRHVLHGHPARAVADDVDLLGPGRTGILPRSESASCGAEGSHSCRGASHKTISVTPTRWCGRICRPIYWKAFGIALLLGFVIGLGWIAWNLFELHVLG